MSHVAAMGSGSAELWEPSLRVCALLTSHDKGCWWVTQLSMDLLAAVPGWSTTMPVMSLLHVPLATERVCLNLDEFSCGFEPS